MGTDPEQGAGRGRPPRSPDVGRAERDERGQCAERDGVREPGDRGRLEPEVVRPGAGDEEQMHQAGRDPVGERERDGDDQHDAGADREGTATHQSTHHRFVLSVHNGVAGGINRVIAPADREVAGEDRCCDEETPGRTSPGRPGHGRDQRGDGDRRSRVAGERETTDGPSGSAHRSNDATMTRIAAVRPALPPNRYPQSELTAAFADICLPDGKGTALLRRLHANAGVSFRHLALPLEQYAVLKDFGDANDAWIAAAVDLGAEAVAGAVKDAGLTLDDVDVLMFTTVTGVAAPSIDARVAMRLGLREDVKRLPLFGLGLCGWGRGHCPDARLFARLADARRRTAVGGVVLVDAAAGRLVVAEPRRWGVVRGRRGGGGADRVGASVGVRAVGGGDAEPAVSGLRAGDGVGRRVGWVPDRARGGRARGGADLSRWRRAGLSRRLTA